MVTWILPFLVLVVLCLPLVAQDSEEVEPSPEYKGGSALAIALEPRVGGVVWQGQSFPTSPTAEFPNTNGIRGNFLFNGPTIPTFGFGARIHLGDVIRFAPSLDFTFDEYVFRPDLGRAFPTQNMTGKGVAGNGIVSPIALVVGFVVSVPLWFEVHLSDRLYLGVAPGIVFYPRIALSAIDGSTGIEAIGDYLNKEARWLYPETAVSLRYAVLPWLTAGFEIQVLYPIWHAWSSESTPFYDNMMIHTSFALDFYL